MMINRFFLVTILIFGLFFNTASAQEDSEKHIPGTVLGINFYEGKQDTIPLVAANVFWMNSTIGTTTNDRGKFFILKPDLSEPKIIVSYVGFENDTVLVNLEQPRIVVYLNTIRNLEGVTVRAERPKITIDRKEVVNKEIISEAGLETCACCDLAESFENTVSVDVEQTDAISGAKRIKMLGLAGFYNQLLIEKKPVMRGLISPFGLEYIPGFWIESISISKGTASVTTGYESITGQINVELKKPGKTKPFAANIYQNNMGRSEAVLTLSKQINPNVSTMLLSYGTYSRSKWDKNSDTFLDIPLISTINVMNRWKFEGDRKVGQVGFKIIHDDRDGGQKHFDFENPSLLNSVYGSNNKIRRYEFYTKSGMFLDDRGSSIGLILSGIQHDQKSFWGMKNYAGDETSFYTNLTYQKVLERHKLSSGVSYTFDDKKETYINLEYQTKENIPGLFAEYTYQIENKFTSQIGFRYDDHNLYGKFYTPRFHFKYQKDPKTSIRFSLGKGYRNPHVFMDNPAILASSKELIFLEQPKAEEALNTGVQIIRDFYLGHNKPATLIVDFYRTNFQNQVVVDLEQNSQQIILYNLNGKSYSNSAQFEFAATVFSGFEMTTAFRVNDVKTTFMHQLSEVPLNNKYKGLLVLSYTLPNKKWQLDFTTQYNGRTRLPNTSMNPVQYQIDVYSPSYLLLFSQIKRKFNRWELYAGIENITNFKQNNPILAWNEPFSPYFDSSLIWGPTVGRRFYFGIRID